MLNIHRPTTPDELRSAWASAQVRVAGLLLMVATAQFFVAMAVEADLRPGYSDSANTISDLGVNINGWSYAWIFNSSIILLGILTFVAVLLLIPIFPRRRLATLAEVFLMIGIAGAIAVGIFTEQTYPQYHAHDIASIVTFLFANFGLLFMGIAMFRDPVWDFHAPLTLILGLVAVLSLADYVASWLAKSGYLGLGEGGLERVVAFPVLIWAFVMGYRILEWSLHPQQRPGAVTSVPPS